MYYVIYERPLMGTLASVLESSGSYGNWIISVTFSWFWQFTSHAREAMKRMQIVRNSILVCFRKRKRSLIPGRETNYEGKDPTRHPLLEVVTYWHCVFGGRFHQIFIEEVMLTLAVHKLMYAWVGPEIYRLLVLLVVQILIMGHNGVDKRTLSYCLRA